MLPQFVSAKRGKNSSQLTVISYNMRYGTAEDGVNAWEFRKPATIKMIKKHKPDILGVQEALDFQLAFILENCTNYEAVGVGRIDGKHDGEHASIMYNKKKIEINFFILLFYKKFSDSVWFYLSKACELSFRKKFTTLRPPILSCFVS